MDVPFLPQAAPVPSPLAESSAAALEWPRLRDYLSTRTWSPLGKAWVLALEPSQDLAWIESQQQRTAEMRALYNAGGSFDFHGLFDPADLLEKARIEGSALEALEILALVAVVERINAWRKLITTPQTNAFLTATNSTANKFVIPSEAALAAQPRNPRILPAETTAQPADESSRPANTQTQSNGIARLSLPIRDASLEPLLKQLSGKIEPDGSLSDDASPELRRIRRAMEQQHRAIEESLRRALNRLAAEGSTQDAVITIRGDRFVIPVRSEFKRRVPGVVHGSSSTGQTVFVEPLETIEQNNELVRLLDEEQSEIHRILVAMTRSLAADAPTILAGAIILAEIESHAARARFANDLNCSRPVFAASAAPRLSLTNARHPLLELRMLTEARAAGTEPKQPTPLTVALEDDARQLIISGPNTGGKTVSLKTIGLLSLMAQAGVPVPADEAVLPLFTAVYADIGDAQSIERNLSSFSAHVVNLDRISREATASSLVLLDELGSATDPEEGAALAVAVSKYFLDARVWSCITTHLTSLKIYAANNAGVLNAAVGFDQETLTPTYKLRLGVPGASAGLNIASRLGLSPEIIAAARAQLSTQTADIAAFLDRLHQQLVAVNEERAALAQKEEELRKQKILLDLEGRAEVKQRTRELEKKLDSLLNDFDTQLRESVKAIGDKAVARRLQRDSATTIARARREFGEQFKTTVTEHMNPVKTSGTTPDAAQAPATPEPGDTVRLKSLNRQARVERVLERTPDGVAKSLEVAVGPMKMKIPIGDVAEIEKAKPAVAGVTPLEAARRKGGVTVSTVEDPDYLPMELNVIGRTADEAHDEVARYIDRAFLAGMPRIRIVHGTGMGILRRTLRDFLRSHPHVANITEPPQNLGGQGATEVELRQ